MLSGQKNVKIMQIYEFMKPQFVWVTAYSQGTNPKSEFLKCLYFRFVL